MARPVQVTCLQCAETSPAHRFTLVDAEDNKYDHNGAPLPEQPETTPKGRSLTRIFGGPPPRKKKQTTRERLDLLARNLDIVCPHCGEHLPSALLKRKTIIVAVVGETGSAKTTFLSASIVKWRDGKDIAEAGITYSPEKLSDTFTTAMQKLFLDHVAPGTTIPGPRREPLIIGAKSSAGAVNIVLIDVPGEYMTDAGEMARNTKFIAAANHIFILVTPMIALGDRNRPLARAILSNQRIAASLAESRGENDQSTDTLLQVINAIPQLQNGDDRQIATPHRGVFVILTKADMLVGLHHSKQFAARAEGLIPPPDWIRGDGSGSDDINADVIDHTSLRTRELICDMNSQIGSNLYLYFPTAKYFAVSATGCPSHYDPARDESHFEDVVPYRCVDPFLSMLRSIPELGLAIHR
ncbi:hypothetical protein [Rhodococcus ruber]